MNEQKRWSREQLRSLCMTYRKEGKKIGFTSGVFDIIHAGHIEFLEKAKAHCDVLIVGLNSNRSVRRFKGPDRPVIDEEQRIRILEALSVVDHVFIFDERRNRENIKALKPDIYLKAGDYSEEQLTSKKLLEKQGGVVRLIPLETNISTSKIIRDIQDSSVQSIERFVEKEKSIHLERRQPKAGPALFLDRDGTINKDVGYLHDPDRFELLPNALEGIKRFYDMGYRIIILTNQPGIGIGYFSEEDFYRVNRRMLTLFSKAKIIVDKIYFCPHSKGEQCSCRKPGQALIERAKIELNIDLHNSIFIGDKTSDMETGRRAGMRTVLVGTGFAGKDGEFSGKPDFFAQNVLDVANLILDEEQKPISK